MFAVGTKHGLALALFGVCLGTSGAEAFVGARATITAEGAATPVAMCGRSCRSGGRYIPGPPRVCFQNGLEYCGPSNGVGPPGGVVVVPYGRDRRDGLMAGGMGWMAAEMELMAGAVQRRVKTIVPAASD